MLSAAWAFVGCAVVLLIVLAVVALDRQRLKRRVDELDGRLTGTMLDLDAALDRVTELHSYLQRRESWDLETRVPVPLDIADDRIPNRWTPARPIPGTTSSSRPEGPSRARPEKPACPGPEQAAWPRSTSRPNKPGSATAG